MPMSDAILPKERQTAFQRWEMDSFGDTRPSARPEPAPPPPPRVGIEELAAIREEARAKGYAEGFAEGRAVLQCPGGPQAFGVWSGDVVGIGSHRCPCELSVDAGAAGNRVLLGFKDEGACAFTHDKTVTVDVVRSGCAFRLIVATGEGLHR